MQALALQLTGCTTSGMFSSPLTSLSCISGSLGCTAAAPSPRGTAVGNGRANISQAQRTVPSTWQEAYILNIIINTMPAMW